jgi:hypothetical protein
MSLRKNVLTHRNAAITVSAIMVPSSSTTQIAVVSRETSRAAKHGMTVLLFI